MRIYLGVRRNISGFGYFFEKVVLVTIAIRIARSGDKEILPDTSSETVFLETLRCLEAFVIEIPKGSNTS